MGALRAGQDWVSDRPSPVAAGRGLGLSLHPTQPTPGRSDVGVKTRTEDTPGGLRGARSEFGAVSDVGREGLERGRGMTLVCRGAGDENVEHG